MSTVTLGGNRLGSGNRNKLYMRNFERSTHDIGYLWKSTMAAGTLVPFMSKLALPGDTFDINLDADVLTHPTVGPLFGSYKLQLDVFQIPIRLYQGKLHMNMLGIGMDMSNVHLPQIAIKGLPVTGVNDPDNEQINPSCIFAYLGIRGAGTHATNPGGTVTRNFNAVPYLGYWDIYKNYYANKQEEIGAVIHKQFVEGFVTEGTITTGGVTETIPLDSLTNVTVQIKKISFMQITGLTATYPIENVIMDQLTYADDGTAIVSTYSVAYYFKDWVFNGTVWIGTNPSSNVQANSPYDFQNLRIISVDLPSVDVEPGISTFPLENIDNMRKLVLQHFTDDALIINSGNEAPYKYPFETKSDQTRIAQQYSQEGLALKTYNSDLFNNWISTEWIDGPDGISAVTAIDTSGGSFTIDELNLSKKIYDMLNRIALSGGSYDDWLDAVYTHERQRSSENPMYLGGLIKNIVFQEVVSMSESTPDKPLGSLAGRGKIGSKNKGGHVIAKVDEPSYIMGIVSITPNVDYSQGNDWDMNLKTLNDLHKPNLDEIGFQDLVTDQMAWFDTQVDTSGVPVFKSAGKQPAWINYMTSVNVVRGNFADPKQQMYMTLNRRYGWNWDGTAKKTSIKDLTTYIDPTKFNHIFANTKRDAQNFWAQIAVNITARRKMSAKVIPNL